MISCDCSTDDYEPGQFFNTRTRKARKQHECCECHEPIKPGELYEYCTGVWDGDWDEWKTCMPCTRIRQHYCPHGYPLGGLARQIMDCIGFDYRELPTGDGGEFDGDVPLTPVKKASDENQQEH